MIFIAKVVCRYVGTHHWPGWSQYPLGVMVAVVSHARRPAWTAPVLVRVLVVVAVVAGLCAMHVLAAVVGSHPMRAEAAISSHSPVADVGHSSASMASAEGSFASGQVAGPVSASEHHASKHHDSMTECVLFLGAGIALLVLIAWAATKALRPSCWPGDSWLKKTVASTPWRGPPPWRWPRIALCVIRV